MHVRVDTVFNSSHSDGDVGGTERIRRGDAHPARRGVQLHQRGAPQPDALDGVRAAGEHQGDPRPLGGARRDGRGDSRDSSAVVRGLPPQGV